MFIYLLMCTRIDKRRISITYLYDKKTSPDDDQLIDPMSEGLLLLALHE